MTDNTLASVLAGAAAIGALTVAGFLRRADHRRARAAISAQNCPRCGRNYGADIAGAVSVIKYEWVLAPGHTVTGLDLPGTTYLVTCPHCRAEIEFRDNGQPFVHPQAGVLDFTRTGKARYNDSSPSAGV